MKILALEFSTLNRSVATLEIGGGEAHVIQSVTQQSLTHRAGSPFVLLEPPLFENFNPAEIEGIAVGLGPGSYTGIRSSLAIAQGWNLARSIPAVGVSSIDAIAMEAQVRGVRGEIEVVIDAQRGEVYSAGYELSDGGFKLVHPLTILAKPRTQVLVGPEATRWSPSGIEIFPSAAFIGKLAAKLPFVSPESLQPIYLREPSFLKAPATSRSA
jgi:tRNA threonylcarbamoyl adenosine modification protein YeaZ